jgi:hypothetical protein
MGQSDQITQLMTEESTMGQNPNSHVFYGVQVDPAFLDNLSWYDKQCTSASGPVGEDGDNPYLVEDLLNQILRAANTPDYIGIDFVDFYESCSVSECCWYVAARVLETDWEEVQPMDLNLPDDANDHIKEAVKLLGLTTTSEISWFHTASFH